MAEPVRIVDGSGALVTAAETVDGITYQLVKLADSEVERIAQRVMELLGTTKLKGTHG